MFPPHSSIKVPRSCNHKLRKLKSIKRAVKWGKLLFHYSNSNNNQCARHAKFFFISIFHGEWVRMAANALSAIFSDPIPRLLKYHSTFLSITILLCFRRSDNKERKEELRDVDKMVIYCGIVGLLEKWSVGKIYARIIICHFLFYCRRRCCFRLSLKIDLDFLFSLTVDYSLWEYV